MQEREANVICQAASSGGGGKEVYNTIISQEREYCMQWGFLKKQGTNTKNKLRKCNEKGKWTAFLIDIVEGKEKGKKLWKKEKRGVRKNGKGGGSLKNERMK